MKHVVYMLHDLRNCAQKIKAVELGQVGLEYGATGSAAGHEQDRPQAMSFTTLFSG
jgi:hypothetical protein